MWASHGVRVLVAEDDAGVRELVQTRLQVAGYETYAVSDGHQAVARGLALKPQILVLDINMPGLDGFGVLEGLRSHGLIPKVLMLTARHAAQDVSRAMALGAKDYLAKPFTDAQLLSRMARLMRAHVAPARKTVLL